MGLTRALSIQMLALLIVTLVLVGATDALLIGAFNCRVFGRSKVESAELVARIVQIVSRYDLLLFQEIRDDTGAAIALLLNQTRIVSGRDYRMLLSSRLGRSTSKEQYAYIYDQTLVSSVGSAATSWRDENDLFERPPYIGEFRDASTQSRFVLVGLHAKPEEAVSEMNGLVTVYDDIREDYSSETPFIFLGDLNADCQYVAQSAWPSVVLKSDTRFKWHINTGVDTTLTNSDCTYDRIVTANLANRTIISNAIAWNFQDVFGLSQTDALAISDHLPVEFFMSLPVTTGGGGLSGGAVAGIIIGVLVVVSLLIAVAIGVYRNRGYNPESAYSAMSSSGDRFDVLVE